MSAHLETELLSAYLDGQVGGSDRARLEAHLRSCRECAARKAGLEGAIRAVAALPAVAPTPDEIRAIRSGVLERAGRPGRAPGRAPGRVPAFLPRGWNLRWLSAAGAAVALLLVGVIGYAAIAPSAHRSTATRPVPEAGAARTPATSASGVPAFSSGADVRAYAASQAAIVQGARSFKGQDAVTETNNFIAGLGAGSTQQATGADTFGAQAPKAAAPQIPTSKLPVRSLAGCLETVLGAAPTTMVPLQAVAVTYQGTPAWLLVFASSGPAGAPNQVRTWVQSQASCSTLDQSSFTP